MWRAWAAAVVVVPLAVMGLVAVPGSTVEPNPIHTVALVDPATGQWHLYNEAGVRYSSFYFGNPGDYPIVGDWDCDGYESPGMYRQSDGYVYLRNFSTQGVADVRFFFGNPGDVPLAGDFNADGCDTVSIYRPSEQRFYIINQLGRDEGGLGAAEFSYVFGNPGDKPFVGDFDGDRVETVGLHRESTGLVYFRNTHTQGPADSQFIFGDPDDRLVAGDWTGDGVFTPALFRPSNTTMYFRYSNTAGTADAQWTGGEADWLPLAGYFGVPDPPSGTVPSTLPAVTSTTVQPPGGTTTTTTTTLPPGPPCDIAVTGLGDADGGTNQLREAITDVCDGGTIRVLPGTITLTRGVLVIPADKTITITATDTAAGFTIDGNGASQVMAVETGAELTLRNGTIAGGYPTIGQHGAGLHNSGTLTVADSVITGNNSHVGVGAGIHNAGDLLVVDSVIRNNTSSGGGGVYNTGTVEIHNSEITSNGAGSKKGGGIHNMTPGVVTIVGSLLNDNGGFLGGGIFNNGTVTITDSAITGCRSYSGAGIHNAAGLVQLEGSTSITGGSGGTSGGGITNSGTVVMLGATTISGNVSESSAGVSNTGIFEMHGQSTVAGNTAQDGTVILGEGGGFKNSGTVTLFDDASITSNHADYHGGGIYNTGTITLWGTTSITLNSAGLLGGGIYNNGGDLTILPAASVSGNTPDDIYEVP